MLWIFVGVAPNANAQGNDLWQKAFVRPYGAILVAEITYEPEKFLIQNQGKQIKIAGKYLDTNISSDATKSYSMIVWGNRFKGVSCDSVDKDTMYEAMNLIAGSEVMASGVVKSLYKGWLHLDKCTINDDVTLFHASDPRLILGSWCGFFRNELSRKLTFSRNEQGDYIRENFEFTNGDWRPWSINPKKVRVRRSTNEYVVHNVDKKGTYNRKKFQIKGYDQMFSEDHVYNRCK